MKPVYGERVGNANLITILADLQLKRNIPIVSAEKLAELTPLSRYVAEVVNLKFDDHSPYTGHSAFAHKGGIHVAAMRRNAFSYQHVVPELVGNQQRVVVSELSGRGNLLSKAEDFGLAGGDVGNVLNEIKALEAKGFSFEAAEASVALMMKRAEAGYRAPFELVDFLVNAARTFVFTTGLAPALAAAAREALAISVAEGDRRERLAANARALRKALVPRFPEVSEMHLVDYKLRILDGANGTGATTRLLVDSQRGTRRGLRYIAIPADLV